MPVGLLNNADTDVAFPIVDRHPDDQILIFEGLQFLDELTDGLHARDPVWDWMANISHDA